MTNYLIMDTVQDALERTEGAATERGNPNYSRIWSFIPDNTSDKAALCIHGQYLNMLSPDEVASLVETLPEGWVKNPFE